MIIDASVWVAGVLGEDAHHEVGLAFMRRFVQERRIANVPVLVWAEIAGAVARRTANADRGLKVARFVAAQTWVRGVAVDASLASESMRLAAELRLRGADSVYVALATTLREPLVTLDKEMLERARDAAEVLTPEEWLRGR